MHLMKGRVAHGKPTPDIPVVKYGSKERSRITACDLVQFYLRTNIGVSCNILPVGNKNTCLGKLE